jgi:hypothetical protein
MRKRMWGAIAGVAAGAGAAGAQTPAGNPPPPAAVAPAGDLVPVQDPGFGAPPGLGAAPGHRHLQPVIMPPVAPGPDGDPQGFGPVAGFGPPPGPMYPPPGPYGAPMFQPGGGGLGGHLGTATAPHFWSSFEYLLWYSKSQNYPFPLLTTSAPVDRGLPGRASTLVLAGGGDASVNPLNGARVTFGFFGDADRRYGFEASGFVTEQKANIVDVSTSPAGIPILARPFVDSATPNAISTLVVGSPVLGSARGVVFNGQQTYSVEASGVINLYRDEPGCANAWTIDVLAGYRYLELTEVLRVETTTVVNLPSVTTPVFTTGPFGTVTQTGTTTTAGVLSAAGLIIPSGSVVTIVDEIRTRNQFNGGQVGLRGEVRRGMFALAMSGKVAYGHMMQTVEINGYTNVAQGTAVVPPGGVPATGRAYGGVYANSSNIGRFNNDEFAVIPEVSANLGMAVTPNLTMWVGYNFLYIDKVARPATNLTTRVNSGTIPFSGNYGATNRPLVPNVLFNQDDFWLMGFNTGFTIRF